MEKISSRERVLNAFTHEKYDKIPVDLNGHRSSGISIQAYKNLRKYLGLKESKLYLYDVIQQLAIVEDDVLDYFGVDTVQLGCEYHKKEDFWKDFVLHDGTPCKIPKLVNINTTKEGDYEILAESGIPISIQKKDCFYFEQIYFPLAESDDDKFDKLDEYFNHVMWNAVGAPPSPPLGYSLPDLKIREEQAKELRESTDKAIYAIFGGVMYEMGQYHFRMDNFYMELALNPTRVHNFLDKLLEKYMNQLEKFIKHIAPYVDIIGVGDDWGMQSGPQISTEMFSKFFKPRYKIMWQYIKKHAPHLKICMHSCGGIEPLIPHFIEIGLDAINPVQINCKDMNPDNLKTKYGKDIVFWGGGCDTGYFLPNASPTEVKEHVRKNIEIFSKDGGFVFQQVHNILANIAPENIVAMYEAVNEFSCE